jgi:hypothetical protein
MCIALVVGGGIRMERLNRLGMERLNRLRMACLLKLSDGSYCGGVGCVHGSGSYCEKELD